MAGSTSRPTKLSRRRFLRDAAMAVSGLYLAACAPPTQERAAPAQVDDAAAAEPTAAIMQAGTGDTEVIFWHGLGGADGQTMTELVEQYTDENPDVTVRQELLTWDVFYQKVPTAVVAGTPPDLIITHEWAVAQFGVREVLRPANDFFEVHGLSMDDFIPNALTNTIYEGNPLGILLDNHGYGFYVNTELLEEAGLDPNTPPQGAEEFAEFAMQLTIDANGVRANESGFDPENVEQWGFVFGNSRWGPLSTIWQYGGDTISEDGTRSTVNEEPVHMALQFWHDAIYEHHFMPVPVGFDRADAYSNRRLAMYQHGSWDLNFIRDQGMEDVTQVWFTPQVGTEQGATWMSAHVMAIPNGVDDEGVEAASNLLLWLSEHGLDWARSGQPPARISQQNSEELQSHWHTGIFAQQFQEIGRFELAHQNISEIQQAYQPEFEAILTNTKTLEQGLSDADERIQSILERG